MDKDSKLSLKEYTIALFLIYAKQVGKQALPNSIPSSLVQSLTTPPPTTTSSGSLISSTRGGQSSDPWAVSQETYMSYIQLFKQHQENDYVGGF